MSNIFSISQTASYLKNHDEYLIITHANPDGDTIGSAFALCSALRILGKKADVLLENLPKRYEFLAQGYKYEDFNPTTIIAVDIAAKAMFGENGEKYAERINLCIDHHGSNERYAENLYLDAKAAANCENIYLIINELGVTVTEQIATCLYTGTATDTGCFRFSNVTPRTLIFAGSLLSYGVNHAKINFDLFEQKTRERIKAERLVTEEIEFCSDGKIAVCAITKEIVAKTGIDESEFDSMAGIPRQIEGVEIGVMLKERDGGFKVSLRTSENYDASEICKHFGGGGHIRAAGCFIEESLENAKREIISVCENAVAN